MERGGNTKQLEEVINTTNIQEKGNKNECNNYRGISFLSTAVKVLEQIIDKRLRKYNI